VPVGVQVSQVGKLGLKVRSKEEATEVQGASIFRVCGEVGQGREKVLLGNVSNEDRAVRVEPVTTVEEVA